MRGGSVLPALFLSGLLLQACGDGQSADPSALLASAKTALAAGDRTRAEQLLNKAVRVDPEAASLRWELAQVYYDGAKFEFAKSHLLAALEHGMSPSAAMPLLARTLLAQGDIKRLLTLELPDDLATSARAQVLALQSQAVRATGDAERAAVLLDQAQTLAPDEPVVVVAQARSLVADRRVAVAEQVLRRLLERAPNDVEALGSLADLCRDSGRLAEADVLYGRALAQTPGQLHLHFLRAEVRLDLGDVAGAEADTAAIEAMAPLSFAALYPRARLLLLDGNADGALAAFEAAGKLIPTHPGTLLYGGVAAYAAGRVNLAEDWLLRALKEMPDNAQARLILGAIRFAEQRYAEAEQYLRPLRAQLPGNPAPRRLLAAVLIAKGDAEQAATLLADLVSSQPDDPRTQLDLSIALVLSGAKDRGAEVLTGLVAEHPDYRPAYEYLVAFFMREAQWPQAVEWAERFVAQYPEDAGALFFSGEALLGDGKREAALVAFRDAIARDAGHPAANLRLAAIALDAGDPAAAAGHFQQILAGDDGNLDALLGLAELAAADQRSDDAAALLARAVAAHPGALGPRLLLARLELARGRAQPAVDALQESAPPELRRDQEYLTLLAEALLAANAPQLAAEVARELVSLSPDSLPAYAVYAQILTSLDDKVALEDTLKQMLTIDPEHVPTRLELVRLQIATERFEVGERMLAPLLEDLDRPPGVDFLYGLILTATDRAAQAVAPLQHAYRSMPSERTLLALINAQAQAGRVDDALARSGEWLDAHPDDVEVRVTRAGHLVQAEQMSAAIAEYERVLDLAPAHVVALNNLAWYALAQDPRRSIEYARRAFEAKPDAVEVAHTLVSAQVEAGEWRDAELTLDRVLPLHPTDTGLIWLSARVLHHKGQAQQALSRLERLLEAELPDVERERARSLLVQIEDELRAEEAKRLW